jgi:hypothetical protein
MSRLLSWTVWLAVCGLAGTGCATHADQLRQVRAAYYENAPEVAEARIDASIKKHPREADAFKLDRATVLLSEGQPKQAEQVLREVRDRFDFLEQKDLAEGALSMLTDDQRLAYAGEDYEKVLVRVFLALANLLGDGQDAGAYALQVAAKQQEIIEAGKDKDGKNPKQDYQRVAAGAYVHAAVREETHLNYDDAARSLQLVCNWAPEFHEGQKELERVKTGRHSAAGNGVLYVFTLVGCGPYKEERAEIVTQAALLVADRILSAVGKHDVTPTLAPVKVPRVVVPWNLVQGVGVGVDGRGVGQTETLTDVGRMAVQQGEAMLPTVIGRAVARRVLKKAAVYGVKSAIPTKQGTPEAAVMEIGLDVAGVIWEATESADTRCWGLLPEKIQVLRVELPAGEHPLALQPVDQHGVPVGPAQPAAVKIENGRNTYVLASFPTGRLVGRIVCSRGDAVPPTVGR